MSARTLPIWPSLRPRMAPRSRASARSGRRTITAHPRRRAKWRRTSTGLAATDPDLAVAAYSFGDTALLADFTAEVIEVAADWADDSGDVLDFGCGAGRVAAALAGRARSVTGVDVSAAMLAIARARVPGARFIEVDGGALPLQGAVFDTVLAVDSFPFLVQTEAIGPQLAEIARVLRPGGRLLVFNWTYGDPAEIEVQIGASPLRLLRGPERPFTRWDATAFLLAPR